MGTAALTLLILISVRDGLKNQDPVPAKSEEVIEAGSSVTLKCAGNGTVKWIVQGGKKDIRNDTILIRKASFKDTRTYSCVYDAPGSVENVAVHLFVKDSSNYLNALFGVVIRFDEHQDAVIPCLLTDPSIPESAVSLEPLDYFKKVTTEFDAKKGFTIRNVQTDLNDHTFRCTVTVNGKKKDTHSMRIYVEKEEIIHSVFLPSYEYIRIQGEDFVTNCTAKSNAKIPIAWEDGTKTIKETEMKYSFVDGIWTITSILSIRSVSYEDSGNYTCVAGNKEPSRKRSANLQVIEKAFVHVSTSQNRSISQLTGLDEELTVDVEAYPSQLSWQWLHNNTGIIKNVSSLSKWEHRGPYRHQSILTLYRMNANETGTYTFYANNSETSASLSFEIKLFGTPSVIMEQYSVNGSHEIKCTSKGYTLPAITWLLCFNTSCSDEEKVPFTDELRQDTQEDVVISVMRLEKFNDTVTIFCLASNIAGTASDKMTITKAILPVVASSTKEAEKFSSMFIVVAAGAAFFFLLSVFFIYKYKQKPKFEVRWQMVQVTEGNQYICIDPTQLPYNERWEFPRANLQFGKTIGAGAFGKVMEATAFGMGKDDSALRVAVKMLKPSAHTDEKEALMSELKILSHLGHHDNIVNLLGACTSGGPILVITEYCQHGDLLNFLRRKAEIMNNNFTAALANSTSDYKNMAVEGKYLGSNSGLGNDSSYIDMKPVTSNRASTLENPLVEEEDMDDHLPLDLHDLLNFSLQVAQGMSFLATKNCIHRDVAARNVLVTHGRMAKICDFGLARDIENDSNYVVKGNARLPVKWMAPESIFDCIYTVQSDVWSYGILLWEIFSLGRSPYPGVVVNRKFYKMIKDGCKMDCPDYAPLDIYRIMKACWDLEPTRRPTFNQLTDFISRQMSIITGQEYANIIQDQQEDDCADTKCVDSPTPPSNGNNYQFC
ncbi:macrophage colony-stimulating factor 1 receptor [Engystomops pustulosus]|uniref:macrophage colony-stimulating factor 1 receptor n=1 Tax=Engystomops pustulosus TaxID=76066 RepID=UPI003AFA4A39